MSDKKKVDETLTPYECKTNNIQTRHSITMSICYITSQVLDISQEALKTLKDNKKDTIGLQSTWRSEYHSYGFYSLKQRRYY